MRIYDEAEAKKLNAEQWQLDLLNLNPNYPYWGPHEDYMIVDGSGWDSAIIHETWDIFGPWTLDDLNECVNFYFSVNRESKECPTCGGNGYHPDAHEVVNTFYSHMNSHGIAWNDKITQDEVQALIDAGRLRDFTRNKPAGYIPTAEEVNAAQRGGEFLMSHDAINRSILIEARLKRLGLPHHCPTCEGSGYVYTAPNAHVTLTLWILHPRKGCSRGVEISRIEQRDLPAIFAWLRHAAERNAQRFSKIPPPKEENCTLLQ